MSNHLAEYLKITLALHLLLLQGKDDSAEAEALRDASDPLWNQMTEDEKSLFWRFSNALDGVLGEPPA